MFVVKPACQLNSFGRNDNNLRYVFLQKELSKEKNIGPPLSYSV